VSALTDLSNNIEENCGLKGSLVSNCLWSCPQLCVCVRLSPKVTSRRGLSEKGLAPKLIDSPSAKGRSRVPLDLHLKVKRVCV
jgi:hypothetical protein